MTNPSNAGLERAIVALQPIVDTFEPSGLTRTDIWMLSGLVASEFARPPEHSGVTFPMQWIGRKTCDSMADCGNDSQGRPTLCSEMLGPHVEMCHATAGTSTMENFFFQEFGFSPQQVTALMGAHSVGGMHRENSGHVGNWDLSRTSLDAGTFNTTKFFLSRKSFLRKICDSILSDFNVHVFFIYFSTERILD
jgi:hypothetical protein